MHIKFNSILEKIVEKNVQNPFVTFISNSDRFTKSYADFFADVKKFDTSKMQEVHVIRRKNDYMFLVEAVAAWRLGKTVFPMNPDTSVDALVLEANSYFKHRDQNDFLYVFTSGSTAKSKIVPLSEDNVLANIEALIKHHNLNSGVTIGSPLPLFHVNCLGFSFLSSLLSGAHFILFESFNLPELLRAVAREKINVLSLIPPILTSIARAERDLTTVDLSSLKYIVSAATYLSSELVQFFYENLKIRIIQGYGLSESVNFSFSMPLNISDSIYKRVMIEERRPSLGINLPNCKARIVDSNLSTLSEGQIGEICINSPSLMRGYLGDQTKTYFDSEYFKTGDLGYYKVVDGLTYFFITGRIKDIVKRYGENISLVELDEQINLLGINAICCGFLNKYSAEEIAIIVQRNSSPTVSLDEIKKLINLHIPNSIRPKLICMTDDDIRNPSGKPRRGYFSQKFVHYNEVVFSNDIQLKTDPI